MYQINKRDGFFKSLSELQNVWVGDTDLFEKLFDISTGAQVTLRYVAKSALGKYRSDTKTSGFQLFLVCKHDDLAFIETQNLVEQMLELKRMLERDFHQRIPVITCKPTLDSLTTARFGAFLPQRRAVEIVDADNLYERLIKFDAVLTVTDESTADCCTKRLNRGAVDSFQLFTRQYLPAKSCVNDIDAIAWSGSRVFEGEMRFIELKRINSDVAQWSPYSADQANYRCQIKLSELLGIESPHVIAYSVDSDNVALHHIESVSRTEVKSRRNLLTIALILLLIATAMSSFPDMP